MLGAWDQTINIRFCLVPITFERTLLTPQRDRAMSAWKVEVARGPKRNYPPLDPKHMAGFTSSDGTKVQEVDTKGQFIKITE